MVSNDLVSIREDLLSRAGDIALRWYNGAVISSALINRSPEGIKDTLEEIVIESIETITSDTFGPSRAIELGEKVSKLKLGTVDFIGRTQEILSFEFTNELNKDDLKTLHHLVSSFMANFFSGYLENTRKDYMQKQEEIHGKLMEDLLVVDEKLKKTNAELEAMVEERTGELRRLNEELKKEITTRTSAEEILKEREYLLTVIFDTSFLWTGLLDPQGRLLLSNKSTLDYLGLKKEEVIGKYFWDTPWWSHSLELQEQIKSAIMEARKGVSAQFDVFHLDNKENRSDVQFSIRPVKNQDGEVIYLIPEGVNITKMKDAERELKRTRDEMKTLLENANDIYFSINGEAVLTYIGPQIKRFGHDPSDFIGKSISELMPGLGLGDIEESRRIYERRLTHHDESPSTHKFLGPHGEVYWVEESVKIVKDKDGKLISINGIIRDVTSRKEYEEELQNLNEVLRLINKIMSHDISNRLSTAYGNLNLMTERGTYDPELVEAIHLSLKGSIELTKKMADLEKLVLIRDSMKEFDLKQTISPIAEDFPIEFKITGNSRVLADDALISVFNNLISNAVVHGGAKQVVFNIQEIDGTCTISVSNDGTAIPEEIRDKIFGESFSWGDPGGSGLGLFISKKIIERYGGKISLSNYKNGETIFEIQLPMISK